MSDENESSFMMIFKLLSGYPKVTAAVVSVCVLGIIIIYISSSSDSSSSGSSSSGSSSSGSSSSDSSSSGETSESGVGESLTRENDICSSISTDGCPDGYLYNTDSGDTACAETTCDVGISGADLDTCCEQGCTSPGSLPTGYTGNLPATLPVGIGDITGVQCDENYQGYPTYNCTNAGTQYILDGCEHSPVDCVVDWSEWSGCSAECGRGTQTRTYAVTTQPQYGGTPCPTTPESRPCNIEACATCSSYQCPTGYNDKPDKNTIVGNTLETCCDQIITPEAQTSGTQDTDLPICSEIIEAGQLALSRRDELIEDINLEQCMIRCRDNDNCYSFSYKDGIGTNQGIGKCYIYYQSNLRHTRNLDYDYYPEKCQP